MATREPTPGNSFTMPNESRYSRYRPISDITDSGFGTSSLPRFGTLPVNLESMQQNANGFDKSNDVTKVANQRHQHFSLIEPLEESEEEVEMKNTGQLNFIFSTAYLLNP